MNKIIVTQSRAAEAVAILAGIIDEAEKHSPAAQIVLGPEAVSQIREWRENLDKVNHK